MSHPLTHTLATLIWSGRSGCTIPEASIYEVLAHTMFLADYTDEQKADLYALIVESVTDQDSFGTLLHKLDKALTNNEEAFRIG